MEKIILFMDNVQSFLEVQSKLLEQAGYQVLQAPTLEDAEEELNGKRIHVGIFDIRMLDEDDEQDISGLLLAQKEEYISVPKIILTAYPSYEYVREALGLPLDGQPSAVNFLDKDEGPETLIRAVEQVFAQYVRINWDLNIRWGRQGEFLPPHLVGLISPDLPREWLSDRVGELEDVLRKLFYDYDQVTLGEVLARRDGLVFLTAFAYRAEGSEEQFVVACGQLAQVQAEKEHYRSYVPYKAGDRAAALIECAETVRFGAALYRLGGCVVEEVGMFKDFYDQQAIGMVLASVDDLFQVTLQPWYEKGREEHQQPIEAFCRQRLEPDGNVLTQAELEKRVAGICQAALAAGITCLNCSSHRLTLRSPEGTEFFYPNPAPYLYEERITVSPPTLCGITHGRLDGASVLVNRTGQTWVVDFGRTGLGPLVQDFVSFETSVKFDVLKGASAAERHELESCLLAVRHLGEEIDAGGVRPEVKKALRTIGQIRSRAADVVGLQIDSYFVGLLFCAVERFLGYQPELRYTTDEVLVFVHALLSMGMLCQRLTAWEDRLGYLPSQAAESLWVDVDNQEVWVEGRQVTLTPQGFRLLKHLYDHANQLCTRTDIAKHMFGIEYSGVRPSEAKLMDKDQINTSISRLRRDIEPNPSRPKYIVTVRGAGYKLVLRNIPSRDES